MAKTHAIFNASKMVSANVDANVLAGICKTADLDNGTLVTLGKMNYDTTTGKVKGFEYDVTPATAAADGLWIVDAPEVGYTPEMQIYNDPRYFYNEQGRAFTIRALNAGVDVFELSAAAFEDATLPTADKIGQYVQSVANGKFGKTPVAVAPSTGAYFRIEALSDITVGFEQVPGVILRCMANFH